MKAQGRQALRDSRPAPPCTNMAASAMSASPKRCGRRRSALGFAFDYIVVCTVTGSTHAGMVVGFAADGRARKVIGIDASFTPAQTKAQVLDIARNTADLVELGREIAEDDVVLIEDYAYPAYGVPSAADQGGDPAVRAARRHDHRPRLRGKIHAGHDRSRATRDTSRRARRCSTRISAARPRSTDTLTRFATDEVTAYASAVRTSAINSSP